MLSLDSIVIAARTLATEAAFSTGRLKARNAVVVISVTVFRSDKVAVARAVIDGKIFKDSVASKPA